MVKVIAKSQYSESCSLCPRLRRQFKNLRQRYPDYWNKPVPASGPSESSLLIVGLAPGMHGANKTGIPFTGDASGELLFKTLSRLGIEAQVRITNVVKCLPVKNAPNKKELDNCRRFLLAELKAHRAGNDYVLFALGGVAHNSILKTYGLTLSHFPFKHGAVHRFADGGCLVDSYHCSRYNTQTGRLTEAMFYQVLSKAARLSGLLDG
jgi:uracil-DNA glycosylase family 4